MHLLTDENGNPIPHGDHHHDHEHHHDHDHLAPHDHHCEPGTDKSLALLSYMYEHNAHHTEELLDVAKRVQANGKEAVAAKIREAAEKFTEGNSMLHDALHLWEE